MEKHATPILPRFKNNKENSTQPRPDSLFKPKCAHRIKTRTTYAKLEKSLTTNSYSSVTVQNLIAQVLHEIAMLVELH